MKTYLREINDLLDKNKNANNKDVIDLFKIHNIE